MKNGKNRMQNVKEFIKETRFNIHIRNLVEAAMVITEVKMSMNKLAMDYSTFLRTTKEGERVIPF